MIGDAVVSVLLLAGATLHVLAALGLQRFQDVLARVHAATKPATAGLLLIALGAALQLRQPSAVVQLCLAVALQLVTAPLAAHLLGRAASRSTPDLADGTSVDELGRHDRTPPGR